MTEKEKLYLRVINLMGVNPNKDIKNVKFIHEYPDLRVTIILNINNAKYAKERASRIAKDALAKYLFSKKVLTEAYRLKNNSAKNLIWNEALDNYKKSKDNWISASNDVKYWKRVETIRFYCLNELDDLLKTLRKLQREKENAQSN